MNLLYPLNYSTTQPLNNPLIAEWRAILRIAFSRSRFPGGILGQGDAPEGCGSGIKSKT